MVMADAELVAAGYDALYSAYPHSPTLQRIWREGVQGSESQHLDHLGFVTIAELRALARELRISPSATLVDLGCGAGGPGLWIAARAGAQMIGIDISAVAVAQAAARAKALGLSASATFRVADLEQTGLDDGIADAIVSIDALQYAPDKLAALQEAARLLRPGARLALTTFELDPQRAASLPVYGTDPVSDLRPLLEQAGFTVETYEEASGWLARVASTFAAVLDARAQLVDELGAETAGALTWEAEAHLKAHIYRRRVLASALRTGAGASGSAGF
jgi:cyclopropane fatty-acyl-phospholipid synthase-like methyltransferase